MMIAVGDREQASVQVMPDASVTRLIVWLEIMRQQATSIAKDDIKRLRDTLLSAHRDGSVVLHVE